MSKEFKKKEGDEIGKLTGRGVEPIGSFNKPVHRKSWLRTIGEFIGFVKRYTASDLDRLKEAGVALVEAKVDDKRADSEEKIARAADLHASAELKEAQKFVALKEAEGDLILKKAEAIERVANAISKIRQNGGDVSFDLNQLMGLLGNGEKEDE